MQILLQYLFCIWITYCAGGVGLQLGVFALRYPYPNNIMKILNVITSVIYGAISGILFGILFPPIYLFIYVGPIIHYLLMKLL